MKLDSGDAVRELLLPDMLGHRFDGAALHGYPSLVSVYRFASCPLCNLGVHELASRMNEVTRSTGERHVPFPIVAGELGGRYRAWGIETSR